LRFHHHARGVKLSYVGKEVVWTADAVVGANLDKTEGAPAMGDLAANQKIKINSESGLRIEDRWSRAFDGQSPAGKYLAQYFSRSQNDSNAFWLATRHQLLRGVGIQRRAEILHP